ncbi:hypothetical protein Tco_0378921 [Tanacetum coccineum]
MISFHCLPGSVGLPVFSSYNLFVLMFLEEKSSFFPFPFCLTIISGKHRYTFSTFSIVFYSGNNSGTHQKLVAEIDDYRPTICGALDLKIPHLILNLLDLTQPSGSIYQSSFLQCCPGQGDEPASSSSVLNMGISIILPFLKPTSESDDIPHVPLKSKAIPNLLASSASATAAQLLIN